MSRIGSIFPCRVFEGVLEDVRDNFYSRIPSFRAFLAAMKRLDKEMGDAKGTQAKAIYSR